MARRHNLKGWRGLKRAIEDDSVLDDLASKNTEIAKLAKSLKTSPVAKDFYADEYGFRGSEYVAVCGGQVSESELHELNEIISKHGFKAVKYSFMTTFLL